MIGTEGKRKTSATDFRKEPELINRYQNSVWIVVACCLYPCSTWASEVRVDGTLTVYSLETGIGHTMPQAKRHPDGSIYINACLNGLFKSSDNGETWMRIPWQFDPNGFGISRDGRLWIVDRQPQKSNSVILIGQSSDGGQTWETQDLDCGPFAPGGVDDPYTIATPHGAFTNFFELSDGTLMFSVGLRYDDWDDFENEDQSRPGIRDVMIRTTDGGKTWGDPTIVHQHATETDFAVDPTNPQTVLAFTRIQRGLLPGEDRAATVCSFGWPFKNGMLLKSTDGGRTFNELPGGMTECYGHRGAILWTKNNTVIVTRNRGCRTMEERQTRGRNGAAIEVQISRDGGRTWLADDPDRSSHLGGSTRFVLVPLKEAHSFTSPTVQLAENRFLTVYLAGPDTNTTTDIRTVTWHIDRSSSGSSR